MPHDINDVAMANLGPAQAAELAQLVELEARWENLRAAPATGADGKPTTPELQAKQRAYDAFRAKLAAYNKRYMPAHVPELLVNTPIRLRQWCRAMRNLYLNIEADPQGHNPSHLLEKAYRLADRVARNTGAAPVTRSAPPATVRAAIAELEALDRWSSGLVPPTTLAG
jgi:hypothetical protein